MVTGDKQHGVVGEKLSQPLVVYLLAIYLITTFQVVKVLRLNDSAPVQGVNVSFSVVDTTIPAEAMWISHAIGMNKPARFVTSLVLTSLVKRLSPLKSVIHLRDHS
jgi:hypothetical protein